MLIMPKRSIDFHNDIVREIPFAMCSLVKYFVIFTLHCVCLSKSTCINIHKLMFPTGCVSVFGLFLTPHKDTYNYSYPRQHGCLIFTMTLN